jgi:hypothetical protein
MNIRKRKRFLTVMAVLIMSFVIVPVALAWPFGDVPPGYWAYDQIHRFSNLNITSGCGGGNFCPGDYVTRAQMAVFMTNLTTVWTDQAEPYLFSIDHKYPTGNRPGIISNSRTGNALQGSSYGGSVADHGLRASTNSTATNEYGVFGDNTGAGSGVYGHGTATDSGFGLRASAPAAPAVYADGNSTNVAHYGGYFRGPRGIFAEGEVTAGDAVTGVCSQSVCYGAYFSSTSSLGIYANTSRGDHNYGLSTPDNINALGYTATLGMSYVAQNGSSQALEVGDLVTAAGITAHAADSSAPMMVVDSVSAANATSVVGVVQSAYKVTKTTRPEVTFNKTELKEPEDGENDVLYLPETVDAEAFVQEAVDGPVAPGGLMLITVQGLAQVKVDAAFGAIAAGDLLTVGDSASVLAQPLSVEGGATAQYQGGTLIGKALEPLANGKGLVWVMIDLR